MKCIRIYRSTDQSWIYRSMSAANATADATASAANKTWIFKRKMALVSQKH